MKYILPILLLALVSCATTEIKHSTNISEIVALAKNGNKEAMHNACYRFIYGTNADENYKEALYWCNKAAEAGISSGQTLLAEIYYGGLGISVDYDKAIYWYNMAAKQDHRHALLMLFFMHGQGLGVSPNVELAYMYLKRAADLGYDKAIEILNELHNDSSIKV